MRASPNDLCSVATIVSRFFSAYLIQDLYNINRHVQ